MPPPLLADLNAIDLNHVIADREAICRINPQRFEMEQLDAIVHIDHEQAMVIGYKDVRSDEFWVRGHMPGSPLFPGVLMCEVAAQLASYFAVVNKLIGPDAVLGFGGMDEVRFRGMVKPGDRLVMICKGDKLRARQSTFKTQGFVDGKMVFEAIVIGVPLVLPSKVGV